MVQTKGHNALMLTPIGRLYKKEIMVKKNFLCNPDQKINIEAKSKKRNFCSEGGREG
jgi:hypothetical protein